MASCCVLRTLSEQEIRRAIRTNIEWQQRWARKLECIKYFAEEAPDGFVEYGYFIIMEHQDKIDMLERELERRARVQVFKNIVQHIETYAPL